MLAGFVPVKSAFGEPVDLGAFLVTNRSPEECDLLNILEVPLETKTP
jgi:hypothetical protein